MKTSLRTAWTTKLIVAGVALAALAAAFYNGTLSFTRTFWQHSSLQHGDLANACTIPEASSDDLFFISCGGIY